MKPYANLKRFSDNVNFISRNDPSLARAIKAVRPSSRVVLDGSGGFNVDLGGGALLYPGDARDSAERQVATYRQEPLRLCCPTGEVYFECRELNRHIKTMAAAMSSAPKAEYQGPFAGFAVILGVGLGFHVKNLAEQLDVKTLVVIEPHDELLLHSLHVMDWKGLIQSLARKGRDIRFIRGPDLYSQLILLLRGRDNPYLDGSYIYTHYQTEDFTALTQRLLCDKDLFTINGWVEDQLLMLRNNTGNFARPGFYLQKSRVPSPRMLPAFVVGAGPSLDGSIEDIRRCRDQVVLISASSALKVLLEHGIRPDIHCEVENSPGLAQVAESLAAKHGGLSDITLYASATIDPRIAPHFKRAAYFFRAGLGSTSLYGQGADSTLLSNPTSGNTAVFGALSLGFRELYLFGLDFGARDADHHHSRHSVYYTYENKDEVATYTPYDFDLSVPGNFGGQVKSGYVLNWGRITVGTAIKAAGMVRVFNCSDGAQIPMATPMAAEALSLPSAVIDQGQDVDNAIAALVYCAEPQVDRSQLAGLAERFKAFLALCQERAKEAVGPVPQQAIIPLCDGIIEPLHALEAADRAIYDTLISHIQAMLGGAFHDASILAPTDVEESMARLTQGLSDGFRQLAEVIETEFPPLPHTPSH